jgi:predicted cupin superfamily sugar epimerase
MLIIFCQKKMSDQVKTVIYSSHYWIDKLKLTPHPEGGYYRRSFCTEDILETTALPARFNASRSLATAIYYLLESHQFSAFHRIKSNEIWNFYSGSSLTIYLINAKGDLSTIRLGNDPEKGEQFQVIIPPFCWFAATVNELHSYSLVGCFVVPGFDFADFELATVTSLLKQYPQHQKIIEKLTKNESPVF